VQRALPGRAWLSCRPLSRFRATVNSPLRGNRQLGQGPPSRMHQRHRRCTPNSCRLAATRKSAVLGHKGTFPGSRNRGLQAGCQIERGDTLAAVAIRSRGRSAFLAAPVGPDEPAEVQTKPSPSVWHAPCVPASRDFAPLSNQLWSRTQGKVGCQAECDLLHIAEFGRVISIISDRRRLFPIPRMRRQPAVDRDSNRESAMKSIRCLWHLQRADARPSLKF
jgi:hypothetical protein